MARNIRITDHDINDAVHVAASGTRSATLIRSGLEIVMRTKGSNLTLDYLEDAVDSLVDYFISSGEATRCKQYFQRLYTEQQEASA